MTGQLPCNTPINVARFRTACRLAETVGMQTALLTGKGEPTLFPKQVEQYLKLLMGYRIPIIEMQSNGLLIPKYFKSGTLGYWRDLGLSLVCISITHWNAEKSNRLMDAADKDFCFWDAVDQLNDLGIAVRLNCTMLKDGICTTDDAMQLLSLAQEHNVAQVTLRDVARPNLSDSQGVYEYCKAQYAGADPLLLHYFTTIGTPLLDLPHGVKVFDVNGQNVCVSNCLTDTRDPNDIRQMIYFPDGRLMYDWKYAGARIL
jgi:hypothetical protein